MTNQIPDRLIEEIFVTGSLAPLAELVPVQWRSQFRAAVLADDSLANAKRANTILRDEHKWTDVNKRNGFIATHILRNDNTTSLKIARGKMGGVHAAMSDTLAVEAVRERIRRLIEAPENRGLGSTA